MKAIHTIDPVYDKFSRILILGSFPSVKSREADFFYAHPQNRFWRLMEILYGSKSLNTIDDKKAFLQEHDIALWDVIGECTITGSADSSIRNVIPNDLGRILGTATIEKIFINGSTAGKLYVKYQEKKTNMKAVVLPSTSPANATFSLEKLVEKWKIITD